jgi:UDP-N-acetylglucosamine 1-carboxyvinyltransferase
MAATLLTAEAVTLRNLPAIADTGAMREILVHLGCRVRSLNAGEMRIHAAQVRHSDVPDELGRRMRASIVLLGPLLARTGEARVPRPGGDEIGARRVEQHIRGLRQMGAEVAEGRHEFVVKASRLRGARVILDLPTVTGTENLMMAASLAEGRTEIINAAREPHVQDLARFLNALGAQVFGAGTDEIVVEGVPRLKGAQHRVIADYLEAGTYAIATAATGGDVTIECGPPPDELATVLLKLQLAGVEVEAAAGSIRIRRNRRRHLKAIDLTTWVHPGFPTDLQAQYTALMTQADGECVVSEYIFENRFQHVAELMRMGARITLHGRSAVIQGPTQLHATDVLVPDIRSGAALLIAALCARGQTELRNSWHVDRGYQDPVGKLTGLGAQISRGTAAARQANVDVAGYYE